MQIIQQMEAGKIYLIESKASANSVYFETDALAKLFFRYCDYYLKDYMHVQAYVLNKNGWAMLIKVRSKQTIRKYYEKIETARKLNSVNPEIKEPKAIWWILSERVRLFISTYVRMSNKILGREGSLVRRKYGRYQFESQADAQAYISKIKNDQHEMQQPVEKYRGFAEHFQMSLDILRNPLRSSLWVDICAKKERFLNKLVEIFGYEVPVLRGLSNLVAPKDELAEVNSKSHPTKPPNL